MSHRRWFLPETPDVLGLLRQQAAVTVQGLEAFQSWAGGDAAAADAVRESEHQADDAKRALLSALRAAFVTPLEPEDLFALSRGLDRILGYARDLVAESDAIASAPDRVISEMAALLVEALRAIDKALSYLGTDDDAATNAAEEAIRAHRSLERVYYRGMRALLDVQDRTERISRRELYRRSQRIGEIVIDVAERVMYAVVKQA